MVHAPARARSPPDTKLAGCPPAPLPLLGPLYRSRSRHHPRPSQHPNRRLSSRLSRRLSRRISRRFPLALGAFGLGTGRRKHSHVVRFSFPQPPFLAGAGVLLCRPTKQPHRVGTGTSFAASARNPLRRDKPPAHPPFLSCTRARARTPSKPGRGMGVSSCRGIRHHSTWARPRVAHKSPGALARTRPLIRRYDCRPRLFASHPPSTQSRRV